MGPTLRHILLGLDDDLTPTPTLSPTPEDDTAFSVFFCETIKDKIPLTRDELTQVIEELTKMKQPAAALALARLQPQDIEQDFRLLLHLGSCLMLEADYDDALAMMLKACHAEPEELAPYINIAAIYLHQRDFASCETWAVAGLKIEPNNKELWEILAAALPTNSAKGQQIRTYAGELSSYAGLSLAAHTEDPDDALLKCQYLEDHYQSGGREPEFLVEFTALLGMTGHTNRIPSIVWEAETAHSTPPTWQLYLHWAQACLDQNNEAAAIEPLTKMIRCPDAPNEIADQARSMIADITGKNREPAATVETTNHTT